PMVLRLTPTSAAQNSSVDPDSASGRPAEKPRNSTISTRGFRYTASVSRKEGRGWVESGEVIGKTSPEWRLSSPLPSGEKSTREAHRVRGQGNIDSHFPPHPNPLPQGERALACTCGTATNSLRRPELTQRHRDDLCAGRLVVEFDALNLLAAREDFFRRGLDLLDVLVDGAEVAVEIVDAILEALHIADHQSDFGQNF